MESPFWHITLYVPRDPRPIISFFIKNPSHIPIFLHCYTLSLEFETKREFLHFLHSKAHVSLLMVDFDWPLPFASSFSNRPSSRDDCHKVQ